MHSLTWPSNPPVRMLQIQHLGRCIGHIWQKPWTPACHATPRKELQCRSTSCSGASPYLTLSLQNLSEPCRHLLRTACCLHILPLHSSCCSHKLCAISPSHEPCFSLPQDHPSPTLSSILAGVGLTMEPKLWCDAGMCLQDAASKLLLCHSGTIGKLVCCSGSRPTWIMS